MPRLILLLLLPVVFTAASLLTGAAWLIRPTPGLPLLPLGNAATWGSLVCLAIVMLCQGPRHGWRTPAGLLAVTAIAWGFVGRVASGNWSFRFQGSDLLGWWWGFSGLLALALLLFVTLQAFRSEP